MHKSHAKKVPLVPNSFATMTSYSRSLPTSWIIARSRPIAQNMKEVHEASATDGKDVVLKEHKLTSEQTVRKNRVNGVDCRQSCRHHLQSDWSYC